MRTITRIGGAWRALHRDQRVAALFAIGLVASMLLPWYVDTVVTGGSNARVAHDTLTAFGSFSFVEAAVLLVAGGVLWLLFARAEDRAFHLPGGDGWIITAAGVWAGLLIFYRLLDTPGTTHNASQAVTNVGLEWGIFAALCAAAGLAWSGSRVSAAHHPEPEIVVAPPHPAPPVPAPAPFGKPRVTRGTQIEGQLSIDEATEGPDAGRSPR